MSATVIAIAQRKGGSGKTTLAAHLSVTWAMAKRDVGFIVDEDSAGVRRAMAQRARHGVNARTRIALRPHRQHPSNAAHALSFRPYRRGDALVRLLRKEQL